MQGSEIISLSTDSSENYVENDKNNKSDKKKTFLQDVSGANMTLIAEACLQLLSWGYCSMITSHMHYLIGLTSELKNVIFIYPLHMTVQTIIRLGNDKWTYPLVRYKKIKKFSLYGFAVRLIFAGSNVFQSTSCHDVLSAHEYPECACRTRIQNSPDILFWLFRYNSLNVLLFCVCPIMTNKRNVSPIWLTLVI